MIRRGYLRKILIVAGLVIVAVYMLFNLLVDLSYAYLDPRIRYR